MCRRRLAALLLRSSALRCFAHFFVVLLTRLVMSDVFMVGLSVADDERRLAAVGVFNTWVGQMEGKHDGLASTSTLLGQKRVEPLTLVAKRAKRVLDAGAPVRSSIELSLLLPFAVIAEPALHHERNSVVNAFARVVGDRLRLAAKLHEPTLEVGLADLAKPLGLHRPRGLL